MAVGVASLVELCVWRLARSIRYGPRKFRIARLSELPPRALDVLLGILITGNALKDYVLEHMLTEETHTLGLHGARQLRRSVLIKIGSCCLNLRALDLRRCQHVTNHIVRNVLQQCGKLELLRVDGCSKISDSAFVSTDSRSQLVGLLKLRELSIGECSQITSGGVVENVMKGAPHLKILGLAFCEFVVTDAVAAKLLYGSELEAIDFSYCSQITDAAFEAGRPVIALRKINITQVPVTDVGLQVLVAQAPLLEDLDASYCLKLTDVGVRALVANCPRLQRLCLRNTDITDASFVELVRCRHLEYLDASWCSRATSGAIAILANSDGATSSGEVTTLVQPPIRHLVFDHLGGCFAQPTATASSLTSLVSAYARSLEWLIISNIRDVVDAASLRAIAMECKALQRLELTLPAERGGESDEKLKAALLNIGHDCRQLSALRIDSSSRPHHRSVAEALALPSFEGLRSLGLTCAGVFDGHDGLMDDELELILSGRTLLDVLELRGCAGLSEGLFPGWCGSQERSDADEVSKQLNQALLSDYALVPSDMSQTSFDARSIGSLSTEAPDTPCHDPVPNQGDRWDSQQRQEPVSCSAALALASVKKVLIEGAKDLSDRSADALALLLRDVQEVELRGSPLLTTSTIGEGRSFRKWCRFIRSVFIVADGRVFSWNSCVRLVSRRHRRKLRGHHSNLTPIVEQRGQECCSSGAEESNSS